ncbi:hypothetical protein [Collimonas fungivorans]|uniref:hypothetical protein n=1 Tax=Collimonas fungivorans TaxID=158899 RepID=UPI0011D1F247|nr:hypothetical protein [Collimonas fungivorans]
MKISSIKAVKSVSYRAVPVFTFLSTLLLSGCVAYSPLPVNYAPSSIKSATGSLSIADFGYLPASASSTKRMFPNQIRNTAVGEFRIDRDVSVFVRDAVFAEFRTMGLKTNDTSKVLSGDIEEFLISDFGFSVDWTLRVKYTLTDSASKKILYQAVKNTQRNTAKFANSFGALNEIIKINSEQLVEDADFIQAIN